MNPNILSVLRSPDDGTPLSKDLISQTGFEYKKTESGVLLLESQKKKSSDTIYSHSMFKKWDAIVEERVQYYTTKNTIAGKLAHLSYKSFNYFNKMSKDDILLDIGCGDGAHVELLRDRSNYIGVDKNLKRLELLKERYPEVTAIYGDASTLPINTKAIKYIFSSNAFEHFWHLKEAITECNRCLSLDGEMIIVIPTEGGLWNIGRKLLSKRHFTRRHPEIDFELISHIEHCNVAQQIIRNLETFFDIKKTFLPTYIPTIYLNVMVEIFCKPKNLF